MPVHIGICSLLSAMMKISWHKYYVDISSDPWADNSDLHTVEWEINLRCILTKFVILNFSDIFYSEKQILKVTFLMTGIIYPTFIKLNWPHSEKFGRLNHSYLFHILQNTCSFTITMEVRFMAWMESLSKRAEIYIMIIHRISLRDLVCMVVSRSLKCLLKTPFT